METKLYIAYGSNLNIEQMSFRCPTAKPVAKSWLHDHRLVFRGAAHGAHATVIPEKGQDVPVVVWEISDKDEAALDRYEGVAGGYYTREFYEVEVDGEMRKALIYIMTPNSNGFPSDGYLDTIAQGYKDFNLPITILNEAVEYAYRYAQYDSWSYRTGNKSKAK